MRLRQTFPCLLLLSFGWLNPAGLGHAQQAQSGPPQDPAAQSAPAQPAPAQPAPAQNAPAQTPAVTPPAAAAGTGTPAAEGQAAPPPTAANTLHVTSRLVILDAVVVDKQGNAVTGLTRDQFQVQEDGEDQAVRNFEAPGHFTPPPDATIDSTADLDSLAPRAPVNIILLDEFNTLFEDMAFARYSLKKWLSKQPDKLDTPTMLVAVSLENFQVLHDYTQNKDEILAALDLHFGAYPWQAHSYAWVAERYATAFFTLRRVAEASIGHPGHKNMIWIGRGLPNVDRIRFSSLDQDRVNNQIQQTVNELRDARVTLYTIDPAGLEVDPSRYGGDAALFPFGGQPDFQALATATGGRNLYGRNDVDAEIGTSIRDGASFYTLTYRPTNTTRDVTKFRRITVTVVGRPDLKVVTRRGYFDSRAPARLTPNGDVSRRLGTELAGAETSTMVYDAVPISLAVSSTPGKYVVHIDGKALVWSPATDTDPRLAKLILTVTTFDKKNKPLKVDARALTFKAPPTAPPVGRLDNPLAMEYQVTPDKKAVRARFLVRVEATGRMGTADADLTLPPPPPSVPAPAPPIPATPQ